MKVKTATIILCSVLLILFTNCSSDLFNQIHQDIVISAPSDINVESFKVERGIWVEWEADPGAEEYILFKSTTATGTYSEIWKGQDVFYRDESIDLGTFYFYQISKKQGRLEFLNEEYGYGVCGHEQEDSFEPNDTQDTGVQFNDITFANIYLYEDLSQHKVEDRDWYYIAIPKRSYAVIELYKINPADCPNLENNYISFNIKEEAPQPLILNQLITIYNYEEYEVNTYFQISINDAENNAKNKVISYRFRLVQIIPV